MNHIDNKAISAPYANKPLSVGTKIRTVADQESIKCICSFTGIAISMDIPAIRGAVLEYTNPLATYANCQGIIEQGEKYLYALDTQILAGMALTVFKYYDLFATNTKQSAALDNAILRTAGKVPLIQALTLSTHINNRNSQKMPQLSLSYVAHSDAQSFGPALQEYTRLIHTIIYPSPLARIEQDSDEEFAAAPRIVKRKAVGISDIERQYENELKENKRIAKVLISEMSEMIAIPHKLTAYVKIACTGRNLVIMDNEVRAKLCAKLLAYNIPCCTKLAKIVKDSENPYDIFSSTSSALDRASDTVESVLNSSSRKLSLAEILAAKKAKETAPVQSISEQVAEHFVEEQGEEQEDIDLAHEEDMKELMREQLALEEPDYPLPIDYNSTACADDAEDF